MITSPLWAFSSCSDNTQTGTTTETVDNRILDRSTDSLNVSCTDSDSPAKRSSTGTVYVNVNTGDMENVEPTKFTDFKIGCVVHIGGVGKSVARDDNSSEGTFHSVYPINVYEINLSDLVASGLVTVDEAVYLTSVRNNGIELRERADLTDTFHKLNARLSASKTLISVFQDTTNANISFRNRINTDVARKVLAQVNHKPSLWPENDGQEMCRDGWQLISGSFRSNGLKEVFLVVKAVDITHLRNVLLENTS